MKAKEVLNILNIGHRTLGTYVKKGLLNPIKINTNHYEYDPEETVMTYSQFPKEALVVARIRYFNQSASLNNQLGYWDKVTVESDETSIKDFKTGQGLPKFKLTFYHKDSSLALSYMWLS